MTNHAAHISLDVAGRLATVGGALHLGIERAAANARIRREQAVDSVSELALRLQEAREDQAAALDRAAAAEAALLAARREIAQLREAVRREQAFSAELRSIVGV
ncbi:hypothetical protein [Methylobacterium planeticum]|uniref:Uncharacterized protein n=1 Tax=Methylobacterium planeticum TaxID=2615211 RepID=A0A6N6MRF4_9HYPH|nr:hypothetical protein [Methylobacterium planeticum]KAB1071160.1 hypothetical protein F6X51_19870 [Methylobacterium planeticum]